MIGETIRLIRVYNDKKLTEVARELDVSPGYLSEIENEKKRPTLEFIERYAKHFDVRPSAILFFNEELNSDPSEKATTKNFIRTKMLKFLQVFEHAKP
jgi:transcriptional regulator with XRE-family HTH domain